MSTQTAYARVLPTPGLPWLRSGIAAGPIFLIVSLLQLPLKEGFDLSKHAFSFLALGEYGWIQQLNFVLTGSLFAVASLQLRARLAGRPRRVAVIAGLLMAGGMVLAGVFPVDPSFGFPQGAPEGTPDQISLSGALHGLGFAVSMTAWVVLLVTLGIQGRRGVEGIGARACFTLAVALVMVPVLSGTSFGTVYLYVAASLAFLHTSVTLMRIDTVGANRGWIRP